jgi:hypothetical protein
MIRFSLSECFRSISSRSILKTLRYYNIFIIQIHLGNYNVFIVQRSLGLYHRPVIPRTFITSMFALFRPKSRPQSITGPITGTTISRIASTREMTQLTTLVYLKYNIIISVYSFLSSTHICNQLDHLSFHQPLLLLLLSCCAP